MGGLILSICAPGSSRSVRLGTIHQFARIAQDRHDKVFRRRWKRSGFFLVKQGAQIGSYDHPLRFECARRRPSFGSVDAEPEQFDGEPVDLQLRQAAAASRARRRLCPGACRTPIRYPTITAIARTTTAAMTIICQRFIQGSLEAYFTSVAFGLQILSEMMNETRFIERLRGKLRRLPGRRIDDADSTRIDFGS